MKKLKPFFKKIIFVFLVVVLFFAAKGYTAQNEFKSDTVYLFWQDGCSHCHDAISYIQNNHKNLNIEMLNIAQDDARKKLIGAVEEFGLSNRIGTPLLIMDKEIIMGWSKEAQQKFKEKSYLFEKK